MDYPRANLYTIWSLNINSTNIFQFLAIFCIKMDYFALKCLILEILSIEPLLICFIRLWTTLVQICTPFDP